MQCAVCDLCGCLLLTIVFTRESTHRGPLPAVGEYGSRRRENAGCADSAHDMRYEALHTSCTKGNVEIQ